MEDGGTAGNVARAVAAVLDWSSSPDARKSAYYYLDCVESGDVRVLASTAFRLVKKDWSSETRLHSFKMLQHLVRLRWEELNPTERRDFASLAVDLMSEMANPSEEWALKSQSAALVAEIIRREGVNLLQELLPSLVSLSNQGPIHGELVSMMLRWLPEDIMFHNKDLEDDRRRLLLWGLAQSLPEILQLLYTLLERHFGAALAEVGRQQLDIAKQHAATVTAILNALSSYAEWAPLPDLAKYGVINGCGLLLSYPDFRLHACEFFKLVCSRKRPIDGTSEYDSAITQIFQMLMNISCELLQKSGSTAIDESELEFAEYLCECMVSLGSSNVQSVSGDDAILSLYFQQMLAFFQHHKLVLHCQSILFWLALMRELLSKSKVIELADLYFGEFSSGPADKSKLLTFVNEEFCQAILDTSFQRILRKEKVHPQSASLFGALELWSDDFEGKEDFDEYCSKLLELMQFVASHKPLVAVSKVSERIVGIVQRLLHLPNPSQELAIMESMRLPLANILVAIFDGSNDFSPIPSDNQLPTCGIFSGLLEQHLSLKWTEPDLAGVLGHYLDALDSFAKYYPDAVGSLINKHIEMLTSLVSSGDIVDCISYTGIRDMRAGKYDGLSVDNIGELNMRITSHTSIMALNLGDLLILGADSKVVSDPSFIFSEKFDKTTKLLDSVFFAFSGAYFLGINISQHILDQFSLVGPEIPTMHEVAVFVANVTTTALSWDLYREEDDYRISIVLVGQIGNDCSVYSVYREGNLFKSRPEMHQVVTEGSGSKAMMAFQDEYPVEVKPEATFDEKKAFGLDYVRRAIERATQVDHRFSGGKIRLISISNGGHDIHVFKVDEHGNYVVDKDEECSAFLLPVQDS